MDLAELERLSREGSLEAVHPDAGWTVRMLRQGRLHLRSAAGLLAG